MAGYMLSKPEEVDYALKISRNEYNEGDDSGEDKSWRGSETPYVGHGQDARLKKTSTNHNIFFTVL